MKKWRGDTLIEVTLAVGIFSMVAIAVVAVVTGSTSSAQTALETTVTREEIDMQAEALRFIQTSYIAGGKTNASGNEMYARLWSAITRLANVDNGTVDYLTYAPTTCSELYDINKANNIAAENAFIINTHKMYELNWDYAHDAVTQPGPGGATKSADAVINDIVVRANNYGSINNKFVATATAPRILYGGEDEWDSVYNQGVGEDISRAEGIYVVAVKDADKGTNIVNGSGAAVGQKAAYYDFYIRTCWFGPGADKPSTIQTVIRLYDPDVIDYAI